MSRLGVTVVLPTLNEEHNVTHVLRALPGIVDEVILVDGGSIDRTVEVAREVRPDIRVVAQRGQGKGDALAWGCAEASHEIIVTLDADGSMDPAEIPRFVDAIVNDQFDYVKGSRFLDAGGSEDLTPLRHLGNALLRRTVNRLFGTNYTDLCYGFNAFRTAHLSLLGLAAGDAPQTTKGSGFEVETCLNIRAAKSGLNIVEVPSFEWKRLNGKSNLRLVRDGLRILSSILGERRSRPKRVAPLVDLPSAQRNELYPYVNRMQAVVTLQHEVGSGG